MADTQSLRTRGSQSIQKDSHSRARAFSGPQREPLLPRVQMHVWCFAARLYAAPAHRGGPGIDADDVRALELDCGQVRHVRSAALHALFPSNSRRDAIRVAPHSASHAQNRLTLIRHSTLAGKRCATYLPKPDRREARRADDLIPRPNRCARLTPSLPTHSTEKLTLRSSSSVSVSGECAGFAVMRSDSGIWTERKNALLLQSASRNQQCKR